MSSSISIRGGRSAQRYGLHPDKSEPLLAPQLADRRIENPNAMSQLRAHRRELRDLHTGRSKAAGAAADRTAQINAEFV
jgi:hypothetical protein